HRLHPLCHRYRGTVRDRRDLHRYHERSCRGLVLAHRRSHPADPRHHPCRRGQLLCAARHGPAHEGTQRVRGIEERKCRGCPPDGRSHHCDRSHHPVRGHRHHLGTHITQQFFL